MMLPFSPFYLVALGFILSSTALWFALAFVRKVSGKLEWIMMLAGTLLVTFTAWSATIVILIEDLSRYRSTLSASRLLELERHLIRSTFTISQAAGLLLLTIGFLIHASRSSNKRNRITELEIMNRSLMEELERLRDR